MKNSADFSPNGRWKTAVRCSRDRASSERQDQRIAADNNRREPTIDRAVQNHRKKRSAEQNLIGDWIEEFPASRRNAQPAREKAVKNIRQRGGDQEPQSQSPILFPKENKYKWSEYEAHDTERVRKMLHLHSPSHGVGIRELVVAEDFIKRRVGHDAVHQGEVHRVPRAFCDNVSKQRLADQS